MRIHTGKQNLTHFIQVNVLWLYEERFSESFTVGCMEHNLASG